MGFTSIHYFHFIDFTSTANESGFQTHAMTFYTLTLKSSTWWRRPSLQTVPCALWKRQTPRRRRPADQSSGVASELRSTQSGSEKTDWSTSTSLSIHKHKRYNILERFVTKIRPWALNSSWTLQILTNGNEKEEYLVRCTVYLTCRRQTFRKCWLLTLSEDLFIRKLEKTILDGLYIPNRNFWEFFSFVNRFEDQELSISIFQEIDELVCSNNSILLF